MKTKLRILALLVSSAFSVGCSSDAPSVEDVEPTIRGFWEDSCKINGESLFKITDIKKTNGIKNGQFYDAFFSFNVTLLNDYDVADSNTHAETEKAINCPSYRAYSLVLFISGKNVPKPNGWKKGEVVNVDNAYKMIRSENGWVITQ